jgi:ParB family chromosome partitioning protein
VGAERAKPYSTLRHAASAYKVDGDAVGLKVKQESAAKEKGRLAKRPQTKAVAKAHPKPAKKVKAA